MPKSSAMMRITFFFLLVASDMGVEMVAGGMDGAEERGKGAKVCGASTQMSLSGYTAQTMNEMRAPIVFCVCGQEIPGATW